MNTLKTACVVLMLLAVLYGVYTVLNRPESKPPKEIAWLKPKDIDTPLVEEGTAVGSVASLSSRDDAPISSPKRASAKKANESAVADASDSFAAKAPDRETEEIFAPPANTKKSKFVPPPDLAQADPAKSSSRDESTTSATSPNSRPFRSPATVAPEKSPYDATTTSVEQNLSSGSDVANSSATKAPPSNSSANSGFRDPSAVSPTKDEFGAPRVQDNPYARDPKSSNGKAAVNNAVSNSGNSSTGSAYLARNIAFERAWQAAQTQIADEKWREALLTLSSAYEDPKLTAAERTKLLDLLDPLAAKVIYSPEHLAELPYTVRRGDTLFTIADQYRVPWQLLQNINDVRNPEVIVPGTKLKVVRGPFQADVNLATNELTLYCQRLYAGRFPIEIGADPAPAPGAYDVRAKELGHVFYTADGKSIAPDDPRNPYGRCWIDLGRELAIHGSPATADPRGSAGCISLSPKDADDVLGILSQGSRVTIRR